MDDDRRTYEIVTRLITAAQDVGWLAAKTLGDSAKPLIERTPDEAVQELHEAERALLAYIRELQQGSEAQR